MRGDYVCTVCGVRVMPKESHETPAACVESWRGIVANRRKALQDAEFKLWLLERAAIAGATP